MNFPRSVVAGLSLLVFVGCSAPEGKSAASSPSSSFALGKDSFSGGVHAFPLAAYIESDEEGLLSRAAEQTLITECMRGFGFDFTYPPINREFVLADAAQARSRLYGLGDLGTAQKYGHHLNPELERDRSGNPTTSPAANFILSGEKPGMDLNTLPDVATTSPGEYQGKVIPPGGCTGAARNKLVGSATLVPQYKLGKDLSITSFYQAKEDSRVQGYFGEWSRCMKKNGYNYTDPLADIEFNLDDPKVTPQEIQAAVTEIKCKESTNLTKRWHAVIVEYENKAIEKNQLALKEEQVKRKAMLAKATEIVSAAK
jgi:hypothetical protein